MQDYLVSIVLADISAGYVAQVEATTEAEAHKIVFEKSGLKERSGVIGSYSKVLSRGQSWPRVWKGPKMYPANGWQKN